MPTSNGRGPSFRTFLTVLSATSLIVTLAHKPSHAEPAVPSGPRPGDGATDQAITGGLQWIGGEAVAYDVYFGTEEDPPLVASNVPDHFYQGGTLAFATVYRWRIVARDQFGAETSGPVWSFVTRENSPPIAPFDPNPPNLGLTGPAVVLGWRSGDPDLQPVTYRLFFGATNPPPQIAIGLTTRSYPIDGLQLNTTYYWRVIATDGEFSTSSLVWRFHVIQLAVLISKFDAAQVGDGVDVTWELSSDEPIESLTLYRRAAGESLPVPLATVDTGARVFRDETVEAGKTYHYELVVRTLDEDVYRSPVATVTMRERALALLQNHPNPFNPQTTISYDLPHVDAPQHVRLSVFDVGGRTIRTLVNQEQPSGSYAVVWEGIDNYGGAVPSGVYFYVLDVDGVRRTRKMVLLK